MTRHVLFSILAGIVLWNVPPTAIAAEPAGSASLLTPEELKFLGSHEHRLHAAGEPASGTNRYVPTVNTLGLRTRCGLAFQMRSHSRVSP